MTASIGWKSVAAHLVSQKQQRLFNSSTAAVLGTEEDSSSLGDKNRCVLSCL